MRKHLYTAVPGILALCAVLAGGCGGGGSAPAPASAAQSRGTVSVGLQFASLPKARAAVKGKTKSAAKPATRAPYPGNIPVGTLSVQVTITNPSTGAALAPPRIVTAPADVNGVKPLVTVQYAALPAGPVRVDVSAFPNDNATGNVLATGSATGQITALQTTTLSAPMALTIKSLTVSPNSIILGNDGGQANIVAKALDANGQPLDLPLQYISSDPDIADVQLGSDPTQATIISGVPTGTIQITVYEPNSELSATVSVTVEIL